MSILDPQIKLILNNDVDLIFKAVSNRRSEEGLTGGAHRPTSLQVGSVGLTFHPHMLGRISLSFGVF